MSLLRQLPIQERPRERLLALGVEALSLTELIAICLGQGSRGNSVLHLAEELLIRFGSLSELLEAPVVQLMEIKGIGEAKAALLKTVFCLAKKASKKVGCAKYPITHPADAYAFIAPHLEDEKQEKLALLLRNARGDLFHHEVICSGTLSEVLVHPREVFHCVLIHRAYSFILAHNHPSGCSSPSKSDIEITNLIRTSANLMGIQLDDHLIIGRGTYTSLWERGVIRRTKY